MANVVDFSEAKIEKKLDKEYEKMTPYQRFEAQEKARCKAILCSVEAESNYDLAKSLTFETRMTVKEAISVLKENPLSSSSNPYGLSVLDQAMSKTEQPCINSFFNK